MTKQSSSNRNRKLIEKKKQLQQEIFEIRNRKYEINKTLDEIWSKKYSLYGESPLKLVNEIYVLNSKLNRLRDKVDEINKKLQSREGTLSPVWVKEYYE